MMIKKSKLFNRRCLEKLVILVILCLFAFIILYPFFWISVTSLKSDEEIRLSPLGIPNKLRWENYRDAWVKGNFSTFFINSTIIVVPTVVIILVTCLLAGYAFANFRFKAQKLFFSYLVAGLGIPLEGAIVSLYFQMNSWRWTNTPLSVIFPMSALIIPFGILLIRGFVSTIPISILDSAKIDGCSNWQILLYIVSPLTKPAIVALLIFSFMWTWNQFFLAMVMLTEESARTLPIGLSYFIGEFNVSQHWLAAGSMITAIPIMIVYIFFQRRFIRGIMVGGLKG